MNKNNNLVLLGGMMCDQRLWAKQCADLNAHFDEIVVGDLTNSSTIESMAQDVLSNVPDKFALAGLSMGGVVAFEIWRQAPERLTHLALFDTNAAAEQPERQLKRQVEIDNAYDGHLRQMMVEKIKQSYLGVTSQANVELLDSILDMAMDLGVAVFERHSMALRDRPDSRPILGTISCPTIIVCGSEDVLCPPDHHEFIAGGIPDTELTVLDNCGHMPPLERPDEVTRLLLELTQEQNQLREATV